jgi:hypothetical protein
MNPLNGFPGPRDGSGPLRPVQVRLTLPNQVSLEFSLLIGNQDLQISIDLHEASSDGEGLLPMLNVQAGAQFPAGRMPAASGWPESRKIPRYGNSASVNFWEGLDLGQQRDFISIAHERAFAARASLMKEGELADQVMVIRGGTVMICVAENGRMRTVAVRGPGQLVGERGALRLSVRSATVIALEPVRALIMTTEDFAAFLSKHPTVLDLVESQIYGRLTEPAGFEDDYFAAGPSPELSGSALPAHPGSQSRPLNGENCTVFLTDVVGFGALGRTDEDRYLIRQALLAMTQSALGPLWQECACKDRGDGLLIAVPPSVPTGKAIDCLLAGLTSELKRHNRIHSESVQFQLRVAVSVGPVTHDTLGPSGDVLVRTARMLEAELFKKALIDSGANLGVIASPFVYETAIRRSGGGPLDPANYVLIPVNVKEFSIEAWMYLVEPVGSLPLMHHGAVPQLRGLSRAS